MALAVTISKFVTSDDALSVQRRRDHQNHAATTTSKTKRSSDVTSRRCLLVSSVVAATASAPQVSDSRTELLKKYLKKSEENKAKNDKERLESYYKRNYKDYFDFVEGSLRGKQDELTESEKCILDWLQKNK